ncbi:hypothetical protein ACH4VR_29265 [Streptomyces sp. NPDC020883]|uniref:hypothetical protein n=1 Tax=Streptomyces sp. NPDC020883 TaxID=3365099 RepID=UPI0037971A57
MNNLAVNYGTDIDWGNSGFLEIYSLSFGVSAILTIILWLFAVGKRAAQGVHFGQALSESLGYLLMSFMASAFAPAAIAYVVKIMDGAAEAMLDSQRAKVSVLAVIIFVVLAALASSGIGAPLACILGFALIMIMLGIWLLLVIRNGLIMSGLIFGPTVFSGLVNKDLWSHTRKWAGVMVAIISVKYVVYTMLALAVALTAGIWPNVAHLNFAQALGTAITFLALLGIALFAPFQIGKFIPILGDEIQSVMDARGSFVNKAKTTYDQGMSSIEGLQGGSNPRLGGGGGGGAGGGGAEGEAVAAGAPQVAAASAAKDNADDTKKQYEDTAVQALGGGQGDAGGDSAGNEEPPSPGSASAPAPSTPAPPPSNSPPGPQPAPAPPADEPASDDEQEA